MSDIANQLQGDREAVLLLYLAQELPRDDRAELERMLASDAALAADLDRLRALQSEVVGGLEEMDAASPLRISDDISTRRVMREMRRFQLELKSRAPVHLEASTLRPWPRWVYPVGAVAAMFFAFLALWGFGVIDIQPQLAEQERSRMPHYETEEYPLYRNQMAQDRLQRILLASFGGYVDDTDHPSELDETEDPAAAETNG
jgi:anti-sigma factor RsiW